MNRAALAVGAVVVAAVVGIKKLWDAGVRREELQREFLAFHDRIKHEQFGERELLRERREALKDCLDRNLPADLKVRPFDQGSYAMQTGVKPLSGDYDIDIGLVFDCDMRRFTGPVQAKQVVLDALRQGSRRVKIRRSCVTVSYGGTEGLPDHHVDIAVYVRSKDGGLLLAKGRARSAANKQFWLECDPESLTRHVRDAFSGAQLSQFRRCVRYLKRWKAYRFDSPAPYSIALTVAALHWFRPNADRLFEDEDDATALLQLLNAMLERFENGRLTVALPIAPFTDLLETMTDKQMRDFELKLRALRDAIITAQTTEMPDGVRELQAQFGTDFA